MEDTLRRRLCGAKGWFVKVGALIHRWRIPVVLGSLLTILAVVPFRWVESGLPCAVRMMLGIDCPGCGLLRSWSYLWHGAWYESFRSYPLGAPLFVGVVLIFFDELYSTSRQADSRDSLIRRLRGSQWIKCVFVLIFAQWIAKLFLV